MSRKVFKDTPVSDINIRKFEKPENLSFEVLMRKFCISVGLLQPGDGRDSVIDLMGLFFKAAKLKRYLTIEEVYEFMLKLKKLGTAQSNVRRNLLRIKDLGFVEKTGNGYRIREWMSFLDLVSEFAKFKIEPTLERIRDYAKAIDSSKVQ